MVTMAAMTAVSFQIPPDRTALSFVGTGFNDIENGDDFRPDGYVYNGGVRRRKWFTSFWTDSMSYGQRMRIWEPHYERVAWIEAIAHRVEKSNDKVWKRMFDIVRQIHEQGGQAHARALHTPSDDEHAYWHYKTEMVTIHADKEPQLTFSFRWVKEPAESELLLPSLGQRLFHFDHALSRRRRGLVKQVALRAIEKKLPPLVPNMAGRIEPVRVNGRTYHFRVVGTRYGGVERVLLADAGGLQETLDLGGEP